MALASSVGRELFGMGPYRRAAEWLGWFLTVSKPCKCSVPYNIGVFNVYLYYCMIV